MSIIADLAGGAAGGILGGANDLARTFNGDQAARDAALAEEQRAVQESYRAEWVARGTRTWFDAFVDGVNRLVRPCFTLGIFVLFAWAILDPPAFTAAMIALERVPQQLWIGCGTIVAFWFGGKFMADAGFAKQVRDVKVATPEATVQASAGPAKPRALTSWLERRKARQQE